MIKESIFDKYNIYCGVDPEAKNGANNHEKRGPQYPLTASAKFPFKYS
ncbi:MAG: hypothetical protein ABFD07_10350 [Methanobacterium sp.]